MMPVQRHVDRFIWQKLQQNAALQLLAHLQFRHQAPAKPGLGEADKAFGRWAQVVYETAIDAEGRQVAMLQEVVRAEHQRRGPGQLIGAHALGKVPRNEGRAGQCTVTHRPEQYAARTGYRALTGTQARRDFTCAHALEADGLVLDHQIHQQVVLRAKFPHGLGPPSRQAVGIQGDPQALRQALFVQRRHQRLQIPLKQPHLLHVVEQAPADLGG
ncbi:hypothetical protein D3C76_1144180 [compost metagenome]